MIISFFEMLLYCACIIFVALLIVWGVQWIFGKTIDCNLYKAGQVIVGLLCFIAFLYWIMPVLGLGGSLPRYFPRHAAGEPTSSGAVYTARMSRVLTQC